MFAGKATAGAGRRKIRHRKSGEKWRVEVSDTASSHIGPNHDDASLSADCVRNKAYRKRAARWNRLRALQSDAQGAKKAGIARFLLSPRLLPAAGTFMVGEPSIGSNTIASCENLTPYPEGYTR